MAIVRPGENGVEEIRSQQITGKRLETSRRKVPTYVYYALLLLVVVFFALIRFRLREMPLERDEGEYAYAGQLILQGINPYQFAYTVKLPGTSAAYAVVLAVLGQTPAGIHLGLMVVNAATTFLVFLLGTWLYGRLAGFVAGASYALLTATPTILGFAGHATHFVVLFAIAGVLLLLKALEAGKTLAFLRQRTALRAGLSHEAARTFLSSLRRRVCDPAGVEAWREPESRGHAHGGACGGRRGAIRHHHPAHVARRTAPEILVLDSRICRSVRDTTEVVRVDIAIC